MHKSCLLRQECVTLHSETIWNDAIKLYTSSWRRRTRITTSARWRLSSTRSLVMKSAAAISISRHWSSTMTARVMRTRNVSFASARCCRCLKSNSVMRVTFDLELPRAYSNFKPVLIRQALRYLIERDLCFLLTGNDMRCKTKHIKIENKKRYETWHYK